MFGSWGDAGFWLLWVVELIGGAALVAVPLAVAVVVMAALTE